MKDAGSYKLQSSKSQKSFLPLISDKALCIIKRSDSLLHEIEDPQYDIKNLKGIVNSKSLINHRKCEHNVFSFIDVHRLFVFNRLTAYFITRTNQQREWTLLKQIEPMNREKRSAEIYLTNQQREENCLTYWTKQMSEENFFNPLNHQSDWNCLIYGTWK